MEFTIEPVLASDFDENSASLVCIEGLHPIVLSCLVSISMAPESGQKLGSWAFDWCLGRDRGISHIYFLGSKCFEYSQLNPR